MKRIITGATGFLGAAVTRHWIRSGHKVIAVGRSRSKIQSMYGASVRAVDWNDLNEWAAEDVKDVDMVLNLAGANIAAKRWTPQRKEEILSSRVNVTKKTAAFCARYRLTLFNASAVGIYGMQETSSRGLPEALDEGSTPLVDDSDFLAMVCRKWEAATASVRERGCRVVQLRFGVILDAREGAFPKMLLPFKLFMGGPLGSGKQPVPWVSLNDVVKAIDFLCGHRDISGPVNIVSPGGLLQKDLAQAIGRAFKRPGWVPAPGFALKIILGEMAESLLLNGQHVRSKVLMNHGFEFEHKTIDEFLKSLKIKI
jgi:uncharacterized protein (TIGR01777 family)